MAKAPPTTGMPAAATSPVRSAYHERDQRDQWKQELCEIGRRIWLREYVAANDGNFSLRISENEVLATPTGMSKGFLTPDMIRKVDMEANPSRAPTGPLPRS